MWGGGGRGEWWRILHDITSTMVPVPVPTCEMYLFRFQQQKISKKSLLYNARSNIVSHQKLASKFYIFDICISFYVGDPTMVPKSKSNLETATQYKIVY
jgi:hypothetical protein